MGCSWGRGVNMMLGLFYLFGKCRKRENVVHGSFVKQVFFSMS